jgi:2-amino-4-hydroxy-6-hydroxymethyldihydropteridine diphosphokinase
MARAYIAIGSNDNPRTHIRAGLAALCQHVTLVAQSPLYRTAPQDTSIDHDYINGAISIETDHPAPDLKALLKRIEREIGRGDTSDGRVALDLDLLLLDDHIMQYDYQGKTYHLPDADIRNRDYVAVPLADIAPDLIHPETGETLRAIADQFGTLIRADDSV